MAPSLQSSCLSFPNPGITGTLPFLTWWWMTVNVAGLSGIYLSNGHLGVPGEVSGAKWLRGRVPECGQHHPLGWDLDAKLRRGAHWIYIYSCPPSLLHPFSLAAMPWTALLYHTMVCRMKKAAPFATSKPIKYLVGKSMKEVIDLPNNSKQKWRRMSPRNPCEYIPGLKG